MGDAIIKGMDVLQQDGDGIGCVRKIPSSLERGLEQSDCKGL